MVSHLLSWVLWLTKCKAWESNGKSSIKSICLRGYILVYLKHVLFLHLRDFLLSIITCSAYILENDRSCFPEKHRKWVDMLWNLVWKFRLINTTAGKCMQVTLLCWYFFKVGLLTLTTFKGYGIVFPFLLIHKNLWKVKVFVAGLFFEIFKDE